MPKRSASYRIEADRNGVQLQIDETFWEDKCSDSGASQLDRNITQVIEEIRAALYIVATCAPKH